jgi:hypothetical protein
MCQFNTKFKFNEFSKDREVKKLKTDNEIKNNEIKSSRYYVIKLVYLKDNFLHVICALELNLNELEVVGDDRNVRLLAL